MNHRQNFNRIVLRKVQNQTFACRPEPNRRRKEVLSRVTKLRMPGKQSKSVYKTDQYSAGGNGTIGGDAIANHPEIALYIPTKSVASHAYLSSAIRRAITSSPSTSAPASLEIIRSAIPALNSETWVCLRSDSATSRFAPRSPAASYPTASPTRSSVAPVVNSRSARHSRPPRPHASR